MRRGRAAGALVVGFSAIALQSCTIGYYDLKNKLDDARSGGVSCDVRYSLSLASATYRETSGARKTHPGQVQGARARYVADTRDVLLQKGCKTATYTESSDEATLEIQIARCFYLSLLPQERATVETAGVIPSWGTRQAEYTYLFKDKSTGRTHRYTVDWKSYNHVILFPVFWVTFLMPDEPSVYRSALANFLEHSESSAPARPSVPVTEPSVSAGAVRVNWCATVVPELTTEEGAPRLRGGAREGLL